MKFEQQLEKSVLIKRYKRFLADVNHPQLGEMTVHCPNTGSMKNCWQEGWHAWLLDSKNPKRKYQYTWVVSENEQGELIGVNTHFANEIVFEAILADKIPELTGFEEAKKEVKYGEENSRIDILLSNKAGERAYIEVKSVTLLEHNGAGYFPDAVTTRGQKHLRELIHCVQNGHRAVLFFLVQHTGIVQVSAAEHIDSEYTRLLERAIDAGVEVVSYNTTISAEEIIINKAIEFCL